MKKTLARLLFLTAFATLFACQKSEKSPLPEPSEKPLLQLPPGFPEPEIPADNLLTVERVELGRRLFFDPILSRDSSISCASCHQPSRAFSDTVARSLGVAGRTGLRNSPSLANVVFLKKLMREGGLPTLEMQVFAPIEEHAEMDFNVLLAAKRLENQPFYIDLAQKAYSRPPDPFVLTRALAAFERTLVSGSSPFDRWFFRGEADAIGASERRGFALFQSEKLGCAGCHSGFLFTDQAFENNGLYEKYADEGRFRLTGDAADRGRFRVPSLRNAALTGPFMHDGSVKTLGEVVDFYTSGGRAHPNRSSKIRPFSLTASERADLLAFLASLTDSDFVRDPRFGSPF